MYYSVEPCVSSLVLVPLIADVWVKTELTKSIISVLQVSFDLSLARGLDYYTGVIYEAILKGRYGETESLLAIPENSWSETTYITYNKGCFRWWKGKEGRTGLVTHIGLLQRAHTLPPFVTSPLRLPY